MPIPFNNLLTIEYSNLFTTSKNFFYITHINPKLVFSDKQLTKLTNLSCYTLSLKVCYIFIKETVFQLNRHTFLSKN